ncbi:hypothetical protein [Bradyrhizobium sp. STM 3843]|uniref:hypothetical protein n=1 Tax=Bradyrhizobium sp. STM 3843 TaxID=551947 RepID=UPI001FCAAFBC|nr:hypothetical protein [Bradyrhizobium sp. STM 3843]
MSYFAAATAWLFGAEALMAAGFGFPSADLASPDTLVLVHMVSIGWLSTAMCGALLQFVPVLVSRPLFAENWALPALVLLTAGLIALLCGFLALGGHLPLWLWLLPLGACLLIAGFGLIAADVVLTVQSAKSLDASARFVLVGMASLCVTVALGATFASQLAGYGGAAIDSVLESGVPLHAIAGLGGWLTLTAMGVSYRLLAMFMLSPDVDERQSRVTLFVGALTLCVAVVGGLVAIEAASGLGAVLLWAGVFGLATIALYGRDVIELYRKRKRRQLELNTQMAAYGFLSLLVAAVLGAVLAATGSFAPYAGAFAFLIAFGWLSGLVLAKLHKIVAFLTWLEAYGPVMGRAPMPRVQELVVEARAKKWFGAYFAAVWVATALLLAGEGTLFRVAALAMAVATGGIIHEFVRTRRLTDVAEPLRLPNGVTEPCLLHAR